MDCESENVNKKSKITVNHEKTTQNDINNSTSNNNDNDGNGTSGNKFTDRTDEASALQYFQFYGYLSQQQNMMQDFVRTATYQKAILSNLSDFQGKIILDVGAGSGILSFFAIQAGAKRVYSIEASSMATFAKNLSDSNYGPLNCDLIYPGKVNKKESHDKKLIRIIAGKVEEIGTDEIPEEIDIIVSEPMGYMLFNERMLESFLHAKKFAGKNKKLKMYPSKGDLHVAPFSDESLFLEQINKANFWQQTNFHGINLSSLHESALDEYFKQPIVDTFDTRILMARSIKHRTDFETAHENDLHLIEIPLEFEILETGHIHGLAFWFDVEFNGSDKVVWLSTAPVEPLTHWYQVRCLVKSPILAKQGDTLRGSVTLTANKKQSYDVEIDMTLQTKILMTNGSENLLVYEQTAKNSNIDLKNPYFRYTGQIQIPPGHSTVSPSDTQNQMTWNSNSQMIAQNQQQIFLNPSTSQTQPSNIFAFNPQANCVIGATGATMQTTNLIGGLNLNNENLIGIPANYDPSLISLPQQQEQLILINNK